MTIPRDCIRVLFASAAKNVSDGSRKYRCDYQAKQLLNSGHHSSTKYYLDVTDRELDDIDVLVLSRLSWSNAATNLIRRARRRKVTVCGDLDDKVYSPWAVKHQGYFRTHQMHGSTGDLTRLAATNRNVLRLLPLLDDVLVSTQSIRSELHILGIDSSVSTNAIDDQQWQPIRRARTELKQILFMTGTRTHDADFQLIVDILADFMADNTDMLLTVLGPISPPVTLRNLPNVVFREKVPLAELYTTISNYDLCLVPLEDTEFNNCKSSLKFIECGLVSVPIIASPRTEFAATIDHGLNGFLAAEPDEWLMLLRQLRLDPQLLAKTARGAHNSVLDQHTVTSRGNQLAEYFMELTERVGSQCS